MSLKSIDGKTDEDDEMDKSKERLGDLFVACRKASKLLHSIKETFHKIPAFVNLFVVLPMHKIVHARRDNRNTISRFNLTHRACVR